MYNTFLKFQTQARTWGGARGNAPPPFLVPSLRVGTPKGEGRQTGKRGKGEEKREQKKGKNKKGEKITEKTTKWRPHLQKRETI